MRRYVFFVAQLYALSILRPLQRAIRARGEDCAWFLLDRSSARYMRADERHLSTVGEVRAFAPDAVFAPGNWVPDFFPGVKVEVFHGLETKERTGDHFRIRGLFDLYCTHGSLTTPRFQALAERHGHFDVRETGWPKLDPLFEAGAAADARRDGIAGRPTVLYASTFTRALTSAPHLVDEIRRMSQSGPWRWIVTLHPKMDPDVVERYRALEGPGLEFVETDDVIPLLRAADVMVSDTSSIVFEFLLLDKPVVTLRNLTPGPHLLDVRRPSEVEGAVERALRRPAGLLAEIRKFADAVHPYRDGRSSERVLAAVDDFIGHRRGRLKRKPANLVRKLRIRMRLKHYGWR
jgi:CDP-glycerol glycerophosphotransferase (TagB/SpsB family)